jgi:hypothetical protein
MAISSHAELAMATFILVNFHRPAHFKGYLTLTNVSFVLNHAKIWHMGLSEHDYIPKISR